MKHVVTTILIVLASQWGVAQTDSTKHPFPVRWGFDLSYTGMSYTESAVFGVGLTFTTKKHGLTLTPHVAHQELFKHPNPWARLGVGLTYRWFPIRSNRVCSPYVFYDVNYSFLGSSVNDKIVIDKKYVGMVIEKQHHSLAHHFGLGAQVNFAKRFFAHAAFGAGVATYGDKEWHRLPGSQNRSEVKNEHPFAHAETAFLFRLGIGYHLSMGREH